MSRATVEQARAPVMGERARAACALTPPGQKRRRLLVMLGACADANGGECKPSPALLIERVAGIETKVKLFSILKRLEEEGFIRRRREGGYDLLFLGDGDEPTTDDGKDGPQ